MRQIAAVTIEPVENGYEIVVDLKPTPAETAVKRKHYVVQGGPEELFRNMWNIWSMATLD